jgi:hypothetical protein
MRDDLRVRVAYALVQCYETVGTLPTGDTYTKWRRSLPEHKRREVPSVSSVVPIAFPTWAVAREEAGLVGNQDRGTRGPQRQWSKDDCLRVVVQYLEDSGSLDRPGYVQWLAEQRARGVSVPSMSSLTFRVSGRWEEVLEQALRLKGEL